MSDEQTNDDGRRLGHMLLFVPEGYPQRCAIAPLGHNPKMAAN